MRLLPLFEREAIPCPASESFLLLVPYLPHFLSGLVNESVLAMGPSSQSAQVPQGMFAGNPGQYSQLKGQGRTGGGQWYLWGIPQATKPVWFDESVEFYEARCQSFQTSGSGGQTGNSLVIGYLWDALVLKTPVMRGTIIPYDGGSWYVLTENQDPGLMVKVA